MTDVCRCQASTRCGSYTASWTPRRAYIELSFDARHVSALAMHRDPASAHLFRANCLAMNDLAAALCERAQTGN